MATSPVSSTPALRAASPTPPPHFAPHRVRRQTPSVGARPETASPGCGLVHHSPAPPPPPSMTRGPTSTRVFHRRSGSLTWDTVCHWGFYFWGRPSPDRPPLDPRAPLCPGRPGLCWGGPHCVGDSTREGTPHNITRLEQAGICGPAVAEPGSVHRYTPTSTQQQPSPMWMCSARPHREEGAKHGK